MSDRPPPTAPHGSIRFGAVVRRTAVLVAIPLIALGCSLPVDERVTRLDGDEIPAEIGEATTTTSTTTTTTTTTLPESTTTLDGAPPPTTTTTTEPQIATAPVRVFYTLGFSTQLIPLQIDLPSPAPLAIIVDRLESPTDLDAVPNLRSSVRDGLILTDRIVVERGTVIIPFDPEVLAGMNDPALERAIAQIVLTFTSFPTLPDQGNIGSVLFEVDGEGLPVFVPAGGGSSEPGEPLAFSDFAELILTTPSPTTTTTRPPPPPTTAPPTTVPDSVPPDSSPTTTVASASGTTTTTSTTVPSETTTTIADG